MSAGTIFGRVVGLCGLECLQNWFWGMVFGPLVSGCLLDLFSGKAFGLWGRAVCGTGLWIGLLAFGDGGVWRGSFLGKREVGGGGGSFNFLHRFSPKPTCRPAFPLGSKQCPLIVFPTLVFCFLFFEYFSFFL